MNEPNNEPKKKRIILAILAAAIALISFFGVSRIAASPEFHRSSIETLEEKQKTVLGLTASSAAASAAANMIPMGAGDSIGDALADLSTHFLIVLCAIFLEKILLTLTGYAAFSFLIPLACLLYIIYLFSGLDALRTLGRKLALFGLVLFLVTPVSIQISNLIEATYRDSMEATIEESNQLSEAAESLPQEEDSPGDDRSLWEKIKDQTPSLGTAVSDTFSKISENISSKANEFMTHLAVMIITSCVIPLLVLAFLLWFVKAIFSLDLPSYPSLFRSAKNTRKRFSRHKSRDRDPEDLL